MNGMHPYTAALVRAQQRTPAKRGQMIGAIKDAVPSGPTPVKATIKGVLGGGVVGGVLGGLAGLVVGSVGHLASMGAGAGALLIGGAALYKSYQPVTELTVAPGGGNIKAKQGSTVTFDPPKGATGYTVSSTSGNAVTGNGVVMTTLPDTVMTMWTDSNGGGAVANYNVSAG